VAIPGTVWVSPDVVSANAPHAAIQAFRHRLEMLTGGDPDYPVVTMEWNIETAGQLRLAGPAASLGYKRVFSDTDGLEDCIARNLPLDAADRRMTSVVDDAR
jgi:hypothetical protein